MDQLGVVESLHHEQRKVHTAPSGALEDRVAYVATPHRQPLALALLEVTPADDGPQRIAGKHTATCFVLVVYVHNPGETPHAACDGLFPLELLRIYIQAVKCDVPPAGEGEACTGAREVEDCLKTLITSTTPRLDLGRWLVLTQGGFHPKRSIQLRLTHQPSGWAANPPHPVFI